MSISSGALLVFLTLFWNILLNAFLEIMNVTVTLNIYYSLGILVLERTFECLLGDIEHDHDLDCLLFLWGS